MHDVDEDELNTVKQAGSNNLWFVVSCRCRRADLVLLFPTYDYFLLTSNF